LEVRLLQLLKLNLQALLLLVPLALVLVPLVLLVPLSLVLPEVEGMENTTNSESLHQDITNLYKSIDCAVVDRFWCTRMAPQRAAPPPVAIRKSCPPPGNASPPSGGAVTPRTLQSSASTPAMARGSDAPLTLDRVYSMLLDEISARQRLEEQVAELKHELDVERKLRLQSSEIYE
jgi:hypothetical protein